MASQRKNIAASSRGRFGVQHASIFDGLKIEGEDESEEEVEDSEEEEPVDQQVPDQVVAAQRTEEVVPVPAPTPSSAVPVLSARAQKKALRQATFAAQAAAAVEAASAAESATIGTLEPVEPQAYAMHPNALSLPPLMHKDEPRTLAVSTPEVEALIEMGVTNQGDGPAGQANPPPLSSTPSAPSPSTSSIAPQPNIPTTKQNPPSKPSTNGGLPHPFHPSNLPPSLPTFSQPSTTSALPQKRSPPSDFIPSEVKEKKAVRFENSIVEADLRSEEQRLAEEAKLAAHQKKVRDASIRTGSTLAMIGGFFTLLLLGHPYMILLVEVCQTLVYKEVTALFGFSTRGSKETHDGTKGDRWSKTLNWYFFAVTNYFLYGESIIYYFKHVVFVDAYFAVFARNHRFISFMLYVIGFCGFVSNLQKPYLPQQFALFCWVHMSLLVVVVSSHFIVNNILEGMIWFFLPASLVVCNDIWAYICGMLFGRTPLIKLSPKKTVEGFVGAFFCTIIFALAWATFCMRFDYMICPVRDLGTSAWSGATCDPNPVFKWRSIPLPIKSILGFALPTLSYAPFQIHAVVMAVFASLFAPFGGFFASGFKRAFKIKDFGHSIPGHGGMTDRMDCQFLMGLFSYVYYSSLIRVNTATPASVLQTIASMTSEQQLQVLHKLQDYLGGKGISW